MQAEIYALTLALVGVIVEAIKPLPRWNSSYSGILALALGAVIGTAIGLELNYGEWTVNVLSGVGGAATAAGIQSAFKAAGKASS